MAKKIESFKVIENTHLNKEIFVLELSGAEKILEIKPGQFVQIKIEDSPSTFLRRPFSVHDVNYGKNTFRILVKIAGKGTLKLSESKPGDILNIIYPLGTCFTLPGINQKVLLAGGGCGIAPLLFLGKYLKANSIIPDILLGFRSTERMFEYQEYADIGKVYLATEDGSGGSKGFITDHPVLKSEKYDTIFCCGPLPMMKAVAQFCVENKINCEVSLENLMACGIGVCLCCVVDTVKGNLCSCVDGPVFNINMLKW